MIKLLGFCIWTHFCKYLKLLTNCYIIMILISLHNFLLHFLLCSSVKKKDCDLAAALSRGNGLEGQLNKSEAALSTALSQNTALTSELADVRSQLAKVGLHVYLSVDWKFLLEELMYAVSLGTVTIQMKRYFKQCSHKYNGMFELISHVWLRLNQCFSIPVLMTHCPACFWCFPPLGLSR